MHVVLSLFPSSTADQLGKLHSGFRAPTAQSIHANEDRIVRASLGAMTTKADVQALLVFLHTAFVAETETALLQPPQRTLALPSRKAIEAFSVNMEKIEYVKEIQNA